MNAEWTGLAREYWQKAGLACQIELRLGPATDTLRTLPADEPIDLAFIDADKTGYASYWAEIVPRTRSGGKFLLYLQFCCQYSFAISIRFSRRPGFDGTISEFGQLSRTNF